MQSDVDLEIQDLLGPGPASGPVAEPPSSVRVLSGGGGGEIAMVGSPFEGASRIDRSVALWAPPVQSADAEILPDKVLLDARTKDSLRNDAYVMGGQRVNRDNIVGSMFLLNSKPAVGVLKAQNKAMDETWEEEFQEEVEDLFGLWAESDNNWPDASRMNTLTALVRLAIGVYVMGGEVLAAAEWIRNPGCPFSTAIQMVDLDRLSNPPTANADPRLRGGVMHDVYGQPIGYHIRKAHPSEFLNSDSYEWKYIEARKPWGRLQIIHILEQTRPAQTRGVAEMVSALKEIRITKSFRDITLQNAVVNATYAAAIESELPTEAIYQMMGAGQQTSEADAMAAIEAYATGYLGAISQYVSKSKNMHIDGVKIPHLFPGTKLNMMPAGKGGPLGTDFESSLLRYIASALGISYEQLSRDYSKTNYSSARAGMNEARKGMVSRKRMVADRFASAIFRLWLEEALNKGLISSMPRNAPSFYEGMNADAYTRCEWIGASQGQIDELKETQAAVLRIRSHLTTYEEEIGRFGGDWRRKFRQMAREQKLAKAIGLELNPTDNMVNALSATKDISK